MLMMPERVLHGDDPLPVVGVALSAELYAAADAAPLKEQGGFGAGLSGHKTHRGVPTRKVVA
ncbi:hypothetical protein [Serratia fonticola]|uniref:hypothetical protein n=1 Tax=Serratia fonticola TaxID=47917 RepID=UPI003AF34FF7